MCRKVIFSLSSRITCSWKTKWSSRCFGPAGKALPKLNNHLSALLRPSCSSSSLSHRALKAEKWFWLTLAFFFLWGVNIHSGVLEDFMHPNLGDSLLFNASSYSCIFLLATQLLTGDCFCYQKMSESAVDFFFILISDANWNKENT